MRTALALLALAAAAAAQPKAPDATYAKVIANKPLTEGKGFAGVITLGQPLPEIYKALGPGREIAGYPFWYFYDAGPWALVVVAQMDSASGAFVVRALEVSGAKAPATSKGVKIGDPIKRVTDAYGAAQPFSASVGNPLFKDMVHVDLKTGASAPLPDTEQVYKDSLYYPKLATAFVITGGKVARIVTVLEDDPLPDWLRDKSKPSAMAVIDPKVDAPTMAGTDTVVLHVPPPPAVEAWHDAEVALDVPKGYKHDGRKWTDASGTERVEIVASKLAGDPAAYFAAEEKRLGGNRLIPKQRTLPADFAARIGADAAYALQVQEGAKGKRGQPLRSFVVMAAKGDRRYTVVVTRTASGAMPSPDGEDLARSVLRSFRIK